MKGFILILYALAIISSIQTKSYVENKEEVEKRLKYLNDKSEEVTDGKILYKYTDQTGIYCEATTNIDQKEFVFNLKKNYIISFCKNLFFHN